MAQPWRIPNLDAEEPLLLCVRKILETRIREMFSYEKSTLETDDIDALHDMRVSGRRVQALLLVFGPLFPKKALKEQMRELRGLLKDLGRVREQDVLLATLRQKMNSMPEDDIRPLVLLTAREELARQKARSALRRKLLTLRRSRFAERLGLLARRRW